MDFRKTIEWYNQNVQTYTEQSAGTDYTARAESFLADLPRNPRILEAGCGPGREAAILHKLGARVTGLDLSEGLLTEARHNYPDLEFIHGDFRELPFPDQSFDGVWAHAALVHLETNEDVQKTLGEFYRVLKPSGKLYLYVKVQIGSEETAVVVDTISNHDRFFRYYTTTGLSASVEQTGFTLDSAREESDVHHARAEVRWCVLCAHK